MFVQPSFLTLNELLAKRLFRVPEYQRAYSWGRKQRQDMFEDIQRVKEQSKNWHFMATIVGLRHEKKLIVTDEYSVVDVVDGQQRLTTLIILLKAIQKKLDPKLTANVKLAAEIQELLVKQDDLSLILLQMNHDSSHLFARYLRKGDYPQIATAKTLAETALLNAMTESENFVAKWGDPFELTTILKNKLTFIFHEIGDEAAVYTVFEVLNSRGLPVPWLDRLKSMLMGVAFENNKGNLQEIINELHQIWQKIYATIGLRQGVGSEALRFAATLRLQKKPSKPLGEEDAVESLMALCSKEPAKAVEISQWLLNVAEAIDRFLRTGKRSHAVTGIAHARLLAISIVLSKFSETEERQLLEQWEKVSFRVFGLCRKDARTMVGEYVRLAWQVNNNGSAASEIAAKLGEIGSDEKEHGIAWAVEHNRDANCYEGWEDELRYLMYRHEEHLAKEKKQKFNNEQWNRIWEKSAAESIEHIYPQSKGSAERTSDGVFVHRLGNLTLLPPGLNSELKDRDPKDKVEAYRKTGLLTAIEVADAMKSGWSRKEIIDREERLLDWIKKTWA